MTREADVAGMVEATKQHRFARFDAPNLHDVDALAEWLNSVSSAAFLSGARHEQIYQVVAAILQPHLAALSAEPVLREAERICRDASAWELAQACKPGVGRRAGDSHRGAHQALHDAADRIAALSHAAETGDVRDA